MLKRTLLMLLSSILLSSCFVRVAAARQFDIEVIIFQRNNPQPSPEYWDQSKQKLAIKPKQWLLSPILNCKGESCLTSTKRQSIPMQINGRGWPYQRPTRVKVLSRGHFKLNRQWNNLARDSHYKPLLHMVWRENVPAPRWSKYLGIMAGQRFPNALRGISDAPYWQLQGGIKISLAHYLYIDSKLLLTEVKQPSSHKQVAQTSTAGPSTTTKQKNAVSSKDQRLVSFKFDQKRRVRSGEIHYFDHPKMGMIIQIRKVK